MAEPTLGAVTLPYPTSWSITPIIGEVAATSLSGKTRTDVIYRKYKYTLRYEALTKTDYETVLNAVNDSLDNGTTPTFTYDKISVASGVVVIPSISDAERVFGAGNDYRIRVDVELLEVNSRI